jgi:outer membrane protein TolC
VVTLVLGSLGLVASNAGAQRGQAPVQLPPPKRPEIPTELTITEPSGITADQVGVRAAATNFTTKAQEETLKAAAAHVDQAWTSFLPRLSGIARYTRVSDFTAENLLPVPPGVNLVLTTQPAAPVPGLSAAQLLSTPAPVVAFPPVLNNYLLEGTISIPISDYFLRIGQAYTAATRARDAAAFDVGAARAKAIADGEVVFYTWLRARGAAVVAIQALFDQRTHLTDATNQFAVGAASRADMLRAETAVAAAELQVERARNLATLGEKQVRIAVHAPDSERLVPAESLDTPPPPVSDNLQRLTQEALGARFEIKSLEANAAAVRHQASVARAAVVPTVSAVADAIYANPNPRKFPLTDQWFPTWDVGAQLTWSLSDALSGAFAGSEFESRASALDAHRDALRDGIELEVLQAYQAAREGDIALEATKRELTSAEEAYRVGRELFLTGRVPSATLTDAETELTRARLDALNAKADARVARVRLAHALGRDARLPRP